MIDIRVGLPFDDKEIDTMIAQVNEIRRKINQTPEEDPAGLAKKIDLYIDLQAVVGELYSQAVYSKNEAYHAKKNEFYKALEAAYHLDTITAKKAEAEQHTLPQIKAEGEAEANASRWEQQFKNCEQKANSLKKRLEIRMAEMYGPQGARR